MQLTFSWMNKDPCCSSPTVNKDGVSLLCCILMDNGGLSLENTVPWIDHGIARLDAVMSGEATTDDWGRETWGAEVWADEVRIYSLLDEDYSESITALSFRRALVAWREFILSPPDSGATKEVEV
jgi:hypothetical protein